jgi:hypothetical protein
MNAVDTNFSTPYCGREGDTRKAETLETRPIRVRLKVSGNNIALGKAAEDSRTPKPCEMAMISGKRASVLECGCPLPLFSHALHGDRQF